MPAATSVRSAALMATSATTSAVPKAAAVTRAGMVFDDHRTSSTAATTAMDTDLQHGADTAGTSAAVDGGSV